MNRPPRAAKWFLTRFQNLQALSKVACPLFLVYTRWTELEEKRAETVNIAQSS